MSDQPPAACLVLVSVPDAETGAAIAARLVDEALAACVTRIPGARSLYRWQGAVEEAAEELLLVKTTPGNWPALRTRIRELHPYEVPEILKLAVEGDGPYLAWLAGECRPGAGG